MNSNRTMLKAGLGFALLVSPVHAESVLDLVPGFDQQRIEAALPITDHVSLEEAAKLLYRVTRVNANTLDSRATPFLEGDRSTGEAVMFSGKLIKKKVFAVPEPLVDLLGFSTFAWAKMSLSSGPSTGEPKSVIVMASAIATDASPGDRFAVTGMVVHSVEQKTPMVIAAKLSWHPQGSPHPGWQWLGDHGVNISDLSNLAARDRRPLGAADADAFYSMLAAAAKIETATSGAPLAPPPVAQSVGPLDLLSQPKAWVGRYLTLLVESIQVTRIAVTSANRREQLGSDHYFQIDAVGDLGKVIVKIEPSSAKGSSAAHTEETRAATFENRYPLSIVMRDLPPFLETAMRDHEGGQAVISDVRVRIQVDGFFFRLWSYETQYMQQFGNDQQFGPLLIAARLKNQESDSADPLGVGVIGWIAAAVTALAIFATWGWHHRTSAADRAIRRRREDKRSRSIDLDHLSS